MIALNQLQPITDDLKSYLRIVEDSQDLEDQWIYYVIDPTGFKDSWDLFGLRYVNLNPLLLDIRLLHIDEEALTLNTFTPEDNASGYILCSSDAYKSIISFIEDTILHENVPKNEEWLTHFSHMKREELLQLRIPAIAIDQAIKTHYRYCFEQDRNTHQIDLLSVPSWTKTYKGQINFKTFLTSQIQDPEFDFYLDSVGKGTLRFDQYTLKEFVIVLKQHLRESF